MAAHGLVIIGASMAGAKAAQGARDHGWDGPIRLVGAEPYLPYERPPLSKGVLTGRDQLSSARIHDPEYYVTSEIDLLLGAPATAIDLAAREVGLTGGRKLRFDKVVLATGSSPRTLPVPGASLTGVFQLRSFDDALALRDQLLPGRRLAVIGASWIGTEVAACARQRGCAVTMIDPLGTPLERVLGVEVGRYFAQLHASHGVDLRLGVGVDAITGTDQVTGVTLADGTRVAADVVVVGVGVVPNVGLAGDAGLALGQGVLVDAFLATSHADVFAAGDITEVDHPTLGERVRVEHWDTALNQGLIAGANAAGAGIVYDRIPYFFSDQYDTGMEYSGWPRPWDQVAFRGDPDDGAFIAFYLSGGRVIGGANVNVWDVNEQVQQLIRAAQPVDLARLTDVDVDPADW
jgi:3-phenylpropionate/trans-cinnamate dioxygenase ferredoxin reductase subunit